MRHQQRIPLTVLLATVMIARLAHGECTDEMRARAQRGMDTTGISIDQAAEIVAGSRIQPARMELRMARETEDQARGELSAGRCRIALELAMRARFHASRALEIARGDGPPSLWGPPPDGRPPDDGGPPGRHPPDRRGPPGSMGPPGPPGLPDPARVMNQVQRTRDLLERARQRIQKCDDDEARQALRAAFEMQRRAEEAIAERRPLAAFQLTVSARERGVGALRICHVEEDLQESAERALRRTDEVLARTRDQVAEQGRDRARRPLKRAMDLQERARAEFRSEHYEESLRLTQSARSLAQHLLRALGGSL